MKGSSPFAVKGRLATGSPKWRMISKAQGHSAGAARRLGTLESQCKVNLANVGAALFSQEEPISQ